MILRAQHRVYEQSDRTGKLLALQICEADESLMIPQLRLSGAITVNYKEINSEFKQFYVDLLQYFSKSQPDAFAMNTFHNGTEFPTIL